VPDHPAALALISAARVPVAAPSANRFGRLSPTTAADVAEGLGDLIDVVLDGGPCRVGLESTVISLSSDSPSILRPGGISREDLEAALGRPVTLVASSARPASPGQLQKHYATRTPLRLLTGDAPSRPTEPGQVGLLALHRAPQDHGYAAVEVLAPDGHLSTAAANLFAALRRLDAAQLDLIVAEPCSEEGLGPAILDRLRRAATDSSRP
jgi:L-threonylcarbamoyladenylate synthase